MGCGSSINQSDNFPLENQQKDKMISICVKFDSGECILYDVKLNEPVSVLQELLYEKIISNIFTENYPKDTFPLELYFADSKLENDTLWYQTSVADLAVITLNDTEIIERLINLKKKNDKQERIEQIQKEFKSTYSGCYKCYNCLCYMKELYPEYEILMQEIMSPQVRSTCPATLPVFNYSSIHT